MTPIDRVARVLHGASLPRSPEVRLQAAIAARLEEHNFTFAREVRLTEEDVIDFLVEGLGLEVKIDGSLSQVTRQLHRYAQSERVAEIFLVTTRSKHRGMPPTLNGKPVRVLHLLGGAL